MTHSQWIQLVPVAQFFGTLAAAGLLLSPARNRAKCFSCLCVMFVLALLTFKFDEPPAGNAKADSIAVTRDDSAAMRSLHRDSASTTPRAKTATPAIIASASDRWIPMSSSSSEVMERNGQIIVRSLISYVEMNAGGEMRNHREWVE